MGGLNARKETGLKGNVSLHSFYKISWIDVFEIFFLHVKTLCIIVYYSLIFCSLYMFYVRSVFFFCVFKKEYILIFVSIAIANVNNIVNRDSIP